MPVRAHACSLRLYMYKTPTQPAPPHPIDTTAGLSFGSNRLTGTLPTELGLLTLLTGLDFAFNYLTGEIPTELGRLTHLISLDLNSNDFEGTIPIGICRLRTEFQLSNFVADFCRGSETALVCPVQQCCQSCAR